ncbi:MAG: hypothetical protein V2I26_00900 [Halieaceae bacterium]|nr:hypothetical protein [Halieaceae bacterium]
MTLRRGSVARVAIGLAATVVSVTALAGMPRGEFACKVRAEGGRLGLVLVQADTRALAEKSAVGAQAFTTDGTRGRATAVLECIVPDDERFADYQFQQFFESLPL